MPYYFYLDRYTVSFQLVARKIIERLRWASDFRALPDTYLDSFMPRPGRVAAIHPFILSTHWRPQVVERLKTGGMGVAAVDVSNADRITSIAAALVNMADAAIVPSKWCKEAYQRSGVKIPVFVVPHGVESYYLTESRHPPTSFRDLARYKEEKGYKFILFSLWHSPHRKGWDLVLRWYAELRRERKDLMLVVLTKEMSYHYATECIGLKCVIVKGWLSEGQLLQLYDLADLYPLFSRCGGFELNGLEAAARLVPVLAADKGPWTEYLPAELLVPSRGRVECEPYSPFYAGYGYEVDVGKAVDKALHVLDNLDDYRERLREWRGKVIARRFTWDAAAEETYKILKTLEEELGRR